MMTGTAIELYLLDHYEDVYQLIPIMCIAALLVFILTLSFRTTRFLTTAFKILLLITFFSGIYGTYLHLNANYEFEREMKPSASDWDLLAESLSGAIPSLAPASMIVMALIGYSYLILLKQKQ